MKKGINKFGPGVFFTLLWALIVISFAKLGDPNSFADMFILTIAFLTGIIMLGLSATELTSKSKK